MQAINEFAGAVVLISHDPHLIELTVDRFWLVKDGLCRQFDGDLADYRDLVLTEDRAGADRGSRYRDPEERKSARREPEERKPSRREPEDRKPSRREPEERKPRRNAAPAQPAGDLKRQLEQSALAVDKLSQALALIEKKLADPALYNQHADIIADWQRKHADVSKRLADAEDAWLRAQASVDRADA